MNSPRSPDAPTPPASEETPAVAATAEGAPPGPPSELESPPDANAAEAVVSRHATLRERLKSRLELPTARPSDAPSPATPSHAPPAASSDPSHDPRVTGEQRRSKRATVRPTIIIPAVEVPPDALANHLWERVVGLVNRAVLRFLARILPREQNRIFVLTVLIGGVCGLAAVLFHLAISAGEHAMIDNALDAPGLWWIPATIVTPIAGALVAGVLLDKVVPAARGSGIPQVKVVYAVRSGRVRLRDAFGKFVISAIQIGSGSSLGREGPTVHVCAGLASGLGRLFALSPRNLRKLIPVGAAAGIAAAFNAPIAAVTFTIEELVGDLDQTVLSGVVVAAALAAVIERGVLGEDPVFVGTGAYDMVHASSLVIYAALGVASAGASVALTRSLLHLRKRIAALARPPRWAHPGIGGLVTGVLAVVVLATLGAHGITGGGYDTLAEALGGHLELSVMAVLCVAKLVATVFSYASGGSGGIFAPTLFIGGMLGGAFGILDQELLGHANSDIGAFVLVGMGAVFAGVIRAPITSVLIVFEMTRGYGLILPLMVANTAAYIFARRWDHKPIYEALIEQDGIEMPHRSQAVLALSALRVAQAMTTEVATLPGDIPVREAVTRLRPPLYATRPVIDDAGALLGLVSEARLRRRLAEGAGDELVRDQLYVREYLYPDQALTHAVVRMSALEVRQMVVVERDDPTHLLGMLTMSDIMRAHAEAASGEEDGSELPDPAKVSAART